MPVVQVPAGPLHYDATGGSGPVVVLCHGVPMDGRCWRKVVPLLPRMRVITPTLPLGGHRVAMRADADLTQQGVAGILGDFLEALDLRDVTLVLNDWGGGQFLINAGRTERIARLVLAACEAFDNFPPKPARALAVAGRVPGAFWLLMQAMRLRQVRQMRGGYGAMALRGIPDDLLSDWFTPARGDPAVRRDFAKVRRRRAVTATTPGAGGALEPVRRAGAGGLGGAGRHDARRTRPATGDPLPRRATGRPGGLRDADRRKPARTLRGPADRLRHLRPLR